MKIALELEFPDEQAISFVRLLQSLPPGLTARFSRLQPGQSSSVASAEGEDELSEAEQHQLLREVFGSRQSEESGDEMVRRIYADRQDQPRDVEL